MIDNKTIELINEKTDIVSLVSEYISLEKAGKNYRGLCPFHNEKTPSFSVSPEKNIAKCMGCGEGGRPITFLSKIKNISFDEAASDLAERLGIEAKVRKPKLANPNEVYYRILKDACEFFSFGLHNSELGKKALDYLHKREITEETIGHFQIGVASKKSDALYNYLKDNGYKVSDMIKLGLVKQKEDGSYYDVFSNRLMFSITNNNGDVVGFSGRTMDPKETIKYVNSSENVVFKKGLLLYNLYESLSEIRKNKQLILVEGFFDAISPYQIGIKNCVASMGTALTKDQAQLIKKVTDRVLLAYDGDNPGQKATIAAIDKLTKEKIVVEVLKIPDGLDPDEFIKQYGGEKFESLLGEYVIDSFRFGYEYYKRNKNFKNANDVNEFVSQMEMFLINADNNIKNMYAKLILDELGVKISSSPLRATIQVETPKRSYKTNSNVKYENIEKSLVIALLKNNDLISYASSKIKPLLDTSTKECSKILAFMYALEDGTKINHESLLEHFSDEDVRKFVLSNIMEDDIYNSLALMPNEKEINEYIRLLNNRRLDIDLNEKRLKIIEEVDVTEKIRLAKERDLILKSKRERGK